MTAQEKCAKRTPVAAPTPRAGAVGGLYAGGDIVATTIGRTCAPFPRVDLSTDRRASATLRRAGAWLLDQARAEAAARGSATATRSFTAMTPATMSVSDSDECEAYLFDPTWSQL